MELICVIFIIISTGADESTTAGIPLFLSKFFPWWDDVHNAIYTRNETEFIGILDNGIKNFTEIYPTIVDQDSEFISETIHGIIDMSEQLKERLNSTCPNYSEIKEFLSNEYAYASLMCFKYIHKKNPEILGKCNAFHRYLSLTY